MFIAFLIYNYETIRNMRNSQSLKREIVIFDGILDYNVSHIKYDTYNKSVSSFKDLSPSVNQNGGAEYSYNFWLYVDKKAIKKSNSSSDIILLLRGSKIKYPYLNKANCHIVNDGTDIFVKNPLIRLKNDSAALILEYNTITSPDAYRENGNTIINCESNSWYDKSKGLLGVYNMDSYIYDKKWVCLTFVLREINPDNDVLYKNKTNLQIYANGVNILDRTIESPYNDGLEGSSVMKHNRAPLYVNPGNLYNKDKDDKTTEQIPADSLLMANLNYYNYALTVNEIQGIFNKGFTKTPAILPSMENKTIEDKYAIAPVITTGTNMPIPF